MLQTKPECQMFTYQTRVKLDNELSHILFIYAGLMGKIQRTLFADLQRGKEASSLKSGYLKRFGITARQFNSLRVQVEGKIASIKELRKDHITELNRRIISIEKKIPKIKNKHTAHQKKRRLCHLRTKRQQLQEDEASGKVPLCFGSRRLFRAQFHLEENGFHSHEDWKEKWQESRNNEIFLLGSKDETSGNQSCTAHIQEDENLTLRLRLPNSMASEFGKYIEISNVKFQYGHEAVLASLYSCLNRKKGDKESGVAISYRLRQDEKGWQIFLTTPLQKPQKITLSGIGAIGIDINVDHLAVAELDRYGNLVKHKKIPLPLHAKNSHQVKASIGDAAKLIIDWCIDTKKPLVLEKLCFQEKKTTLREEASAKHARILSSFAYNAIIQAIKSRGFRFGVEVNQVNPAYTSVIGRCKYAEKYGLSIHEAAAMTIACRFMGVSERLPRHWEKIPDGKGGHVPLSLPARNRDEHVWTSWRKVKGKLSVALIGHFRATKRRSSSRSPPACCDSKISDFAGGTPAHESLAELLG